MKKKTLSFKTSCIQAFVNIYLLNRLHQDQYKLLGITATSSEYKILETNYRDSLNEQKQEHPFVFMRNNYIFYLRDFNGKSLVVCQFYNQLKENELFDWINQVFNWQNLFFHLITYDLSNKFLSFGQELNSMELWCSAIVIELST